jgi:D-aspartate ligase
MKAGAKSRRVLALGPGITLLGVLRTLSKENVDVMALPDIDRITRRSRWYRAGPNELSGATPETLVRKVEALPEQTVLIPCSDLWARTLSALPAEFRARYPASIAPVAALDLLVDKARFSSALDRLRLPHPETRVMTTVQDLDAVPDSVFDSAFLKPAHSQQFFARFGVKAFRIRDRREAQSRLTECMTAGMEMLLQEYIPGAPTDHYFVDGFVDRHGIVRAMFARRRLRMNPPDFGNSTLMISVPIGDTGDAGTTLRTLFADIKYRGIFSAEFKRDPRDGVFNLIEVNARPWWYVEFAARCGVNVCAMAVRDAVGESVETITKYAVGRRCVFPYYDLQAVRTARAAGKLGLFGWASSWIGPYQPVFRWADPMPAVGELATLMWERIGRLGTRGRNKSIRS